MEQRVRRLEREARVWRVLATLGVACALMGAGDGGQIRCRSLVAESEPGAADGLVLFADAQRGGSLSVADGEGESRVLLEQVATNGRFGISLMGDNAMQMLYTGHNEAGIAVIQGPNMENRADVIVGKRAAGFMAKRGAESKVLGLID